MNLIIPIALCLPAMVMSLLLMIDTNSTLTSSIVEIKKIRNILLAGLIQATVYFIEFIFYEYKFFEVRPFGMAAEAVLYISNLFYIITYADLIFSKYQKKLYSKRINRFFFLLPTFILLAFEGLNVLTPIFFDIDPNTFEYIETPWVMIVNVIPVFYIAFSGINDIREWKQSTHYYNLPISLYFLLVIVGIVLESTFFSVPIIPICCAISITLMYIRIVKRIGYIDFLSGLYTRSNLPIYISSQHSKLSSEEYLAGIMLDVNHFKKINDTYGHVVGDRAISSMGEILKTVTKKNGMSFRYGGDEFIVIMKVSDEGQIINMMRKIELAVAEFNANKSDVFELSVSQGFAIYENEMASIVKFIDNMDSEMYKCKYASKAMSADK